MALRSWRKRAERRDTGARADHDGGEVGIFRHAEMLRGVREDGNLALALGALGEEGRADALVEVAALLGLVADDREREVDGFADRPLRGSDRVEARLELAENLHEFLGSEFRGGVLLEEIEDVAAPDVLLELAARGGIEQVVEELGGRILGGKRLEDLLGGFGNDVVLRQGLADRGGAAVRRGHDFIAGEALVLQDGLDEFRAVRREDAERVADLIGEAGAGEGNFEMAGVFVRAIAGELFVHRERGRKRIFPGVP